VRVAGWRSFTKSFKSLSDAVCWVEETENKLRSSNKPRVNVGEITLRDLLRKYGLEVSSNLKGSDRELCKLNMLSRHSIADNKLINLTPKHFEYLRDEKERILAAALSQRNIYIASIIEFAIETGMRRSEILKLQWCDVD
jgi:integrase